MVDRVRSPNGKYEAYHEGEHREKVFTLETSDGEVLLQRIVEVARDPVFTPNGDYVAYWRLSDHTIYCYSTENSSDAGNFDTDQLRDSDDVGRAVNIGLNGVMHSGEPGYEVIDTTYQKNEVLGYISVTGDLIESRV